MIPKHYASISQYEAIDLLVDLHRSTSGVLGSMTRANYRIELTVLGLSVLTSGGLWVLLGVAAPNIAAWFGAACSTLITGLTIYQFTLGPRGRIKVTDALYKEIGRAIAHLRSNQNFNLTQFWDSYKDFEYRLDQLENPPAP